MIRTVQPDGTIVLSGERCVAHIKRLAPGVMYMAYVGSGSILGTTFKAMTDENRFMAELKQLVPGLQSCRLRRYSARSARQIELSRRR